MPRFIDPKARSDLSSLRLTCKAFDRIATPTLFRFLTIQFPDGIGGIPPIADRMAQILQLSESHLLRHVRTVCICCQLQPGKVEASGLCHAKMVLPGVIRAYSGLIALRIDDKWMTGSWAEALTEHMLRMISLESRMSRLRSLSILFPNTHVFYMLLQTSSATSPRPYKRPLLDFVKSIRHLRLSARAAVAGLCRTVSNRYGPSARKDLLPGCEDPSQVNAFFSLAETPDQVLFLELEKSQEVHDIDVFDVNKLKSLHSRKLREMYASPETLLSLLTSNLSILKGIELDVITIKGVHGWANVINSLLMATKLMDFNIANGFYSNYYHRDWYLQLEDYEALRSLERHVNRNRELAGFEPLDSTRFCPN